MRIIGPVNLASTVPFHASQMFSRNVVTLLRHLITEGALTVDPSDEIVSPMLLGAAKYASTQRPRTSMPICMRV